MNIDHMEFAALLMDETVMCGYARNPGLIANHAAELISIARSIQRCAVRKCNVGARPRDAALDTRDHARAAEIAALYGARIKRMTDVRGFALKLLLQSGRHNSMGGPEHGWGVPT